MKIVVVDDEKLVLESVIKQIRELNIAECVEGFQFAKEAFEFIIRNPVELVILDIEIGETSGLELALCIKKKIPETMILFLTAYSRYAVDAFELHAEGYLLKPVSTQKLLAEIKFFMNKRELPSRRLIRVQTFGDFEVFVGNTPVKFGRSKAKELLAYLIDRRGAGVTISSIIACLCEERANDKKSQSLIRQYILDLTASLRAVGAETILNKSKNNVSVNIDLIDCDYYEFIRGNAIAINSFYGEYMNQYSWAEFTTAKLQHK